MIKVEGIHKSFGKVRAVRGVSFDAPDGTITGLLGPNGAGKSTTLRVLYTVLKPDPPDWCAAARRRPLSTADRARKHRLLRRALRSP
jgi:ABC-type Na+ transport system ATPase subunit NatA